MSDFILDLKEFAKSCVLIKQSPPPIVCLCNAPHRSADGDYAHLLIPKKRSQFAEFLQHGSLTRLSNLYQSTCVGLSTALYAGFFLKMVREESKLSK